MADEYSFLLIGSGCRESQMAISIKNSKHNTRLYCISNYEQPQILELCDEYYIHDMKNMDSLQETCLEMCKYHKINYVLIGSETFLMTSLVLELEKNGVFCVAPNQYYARIETSKLYCRELLNRTSMNVYNPDYISVTKGSSMSYILDFLNKHNNQVVVKPDMPMGGKGVKVFGEHLYSRGDILGYMADIFKIDMPKGGPQSEPIVILEEKLEGEEFSFISFTDGNTTLHSFPIKDFKRLDDGNNGPNTGSMGCITDVKLLNFLEPDDITIAKLINENVIACLNNSNKGCVFNDTRYTKIFKINYNDFYKGFLYGSFIKTPSGRLKIIEFNARLGDPEAIPFLKQLHIDFVDLCVNMKNKTLYSLPHVFNPKKSITQYIVPRDYPEKGDVHTLSFSNLYGYENKNIIIGAIQTKGGKLETMSSRTLCVYEDNTHFSPVKANVNQIIKRIMDNNPNIFHTRTDLLDCYKNDKNEPTTNTEDQYKQAGVDIELGNSIVSQIGPVVKETYNDLVVNEIGSFGGCFSLPSGYKDPILVSSIDGVGTKSIVVENVMGVKGYYNLGQDIVNHCVNDILVQGAKPLFFMDYIAASQLSSESVLEFVKGISYACRQVGCVLLGGETAEMPNVYQLNRYDLVGNIVGIVDRENMICPEQTICEGDLIYALPSSGPHTNGYSLIRKIIKEQLDIKSKIDSEFLKQLCAPHKSYLNEITQLQNAQIPIHGLCHVTGGGFHDNIVRILPDGLQEQFDNFEFSSLFKQIQDLGFVDRETMMRVFNCGWGMLIITGSEHKERLCNTLPNATVIGRIILK